MNHGLVNFEGDRIGSRLWSMAMSKSQFVALYTTRVFVEGDTSWNNAWRESLTPGKSGRFPFNGYEYARYEPGYDQPFLDMCLSVYNTFASIVVPRESNDGDALATLAGFDAVAPDVNRRFFFYPNDKRKNTERRLRGLVDGVPLRCEWAYLLGFFYPKPVSVFLTKDVDNLRRFESGDPDTHYFKVLERW